ncbi:MAG: maleylpyruvate isomerase family mycothiol-dependent enzyme [Actinomycetota bacterium]
MGEVGDRYATVRGRITSLVEGLDEAGASTTVPPCPQWSVKDVVAHVTGVCADILGGRLEGVATDPWTQAQVDERKDRSIREIVAEWNEVAPQCEAIAEAFGDAGHQWVADLTTHEHDIRTALGEPGERGAEAVEVSCRWLASRHVGEGFERAFRVLTPEGDDIVLGEGDPQTTVKVGRFDFFRAITGRRSEEQIAAFGWEDDYKPFLGAFSRGPFTMATQPFVE